MGGFAAISISTVGGQAVLLLATPLLTRLYSPDAYGAFASLAAWVAIASTAGALRLDMAIPIAEAGDERALIAVAACTSAAAGVGCMALMRASGHETIVSSSWLGVVAVAYLVWATAMYTVFAAHALRLHQYGAVAKRNLLQSIGTVAGQLIFALSTRSGMGLAGGLGFGRSLGLGSLARSSVRALAGQSGRSPLQSLRRYWRFPALFMPSAVLNVLGTQLPVLLTVRLFGKAEAGKLAQAFVVGAIPAALVGTAISSVVLAELAASVREGQLVQRARYLRVSRALAPVGLAWSLALLFVGRPLLPHILGAKWNGSGSYLGALALSAGAGLVASSLSVVFVIYERARINVLLDAARVGLVSIAGFSAYKLGYGAVHAVLAMSFAMTAVYFSIWWCGLGVVSRPRSPRVEPAASVV